MKWWVQLNGTRREVNVVRSGDELEVSVDASTQAVEFVRLSASLSAMLCRDGRAFSVAHQRLGPNRWRISLGEREFEVVLRDPLERELAARAAAASGPQELRAPIPGKVVRVLVEAGQEVSQGQVLLVLEAMKMENPIVAERPGRVGEVAVEAGVAVEGGQLLVVVD
jgi:biotin carboxyl carrier protein